MKPENTKKLLTRFPILYRQYYLPMTQTCMCWGFECGDGWFDLLWMVSLAIEDELGYSWITRKFGLYIKWLITKWNSLPLKLRWRGNWKKDQGLKWYDKVLVKIGDYLTIDYHLFSVTQVKEKYGTLRYYTSWETERIGRIITIAEAFSENICEVCGQYGQIYNKGWVVVRCEKCRSNYIEERM